MATAPYRKYRVKVYLNASHQLIIDGWKCKLCPFSWEFSLLIRVPLSKQVRFSDLEKELTNFLRPYQNVLLNCQPCFQGCNPTLENVTDRFSRDFYRIIRGLGGILVQVEASETPTKSYILDMQEELDQDGSLPEEQMLSQVIDAVLDCILKEEGTENPEG